MIMSFKLQVVKKYQVVSDYALNKLLPAHSLFHGTPAAVSIVSHGEGLRSDKGSRRNNKSISFTRDLTWLLDGKFGNAIIVLDRDELKTKFKIEPVDAFGYMSEYKYRKQELEERIYSSYIPVKYIKAVIFLKIHKPSEFSDPKLWPQSVKYIHFEPKTKKIEVLNKSEIISDAHTVEESLQLPEIKWSYPTDKELLNEIQSEFDIEKLLISDTWPKKEHYAEAVKDLKAVSKPERLDPKALKGRHIWKSYDDLVKTVKSFGGPKDPESMLAAIEKGDALPMPIIVRRRNGEMTVIGGCTRSGIAALSNQKITGLVIDEKLANEKMADSMELDTEKESQEEKKKDIYKKIGDYYIHNKEKPEFEDQDKFYAHVAEYRYRKIAELRGLPKREWIFKG